MNVGSLFSGIGGIELGFEREGYKTIWCVENNAYCQAILRKRFPTATIYGDITTLDFSTIPKVDIITGGFPCQDISNAGKRIGISGSRSSLWKYYLEDIRILRPKYAVIENVAALADRGLNVVLADLASVGYDAEWYNISASAVGAPHRRERIFIIAYTDGNGWSASGYAQASRESSISEEWQAAPHCAWRKWEHEPCKPCTDVSNSDTTQCDRNGIAERVQTGKSWFGNYCRWEVEPDVGRVVDGLSYRVDRIKCLGNAVVPAVAQVFAQAIKEYEKEKRKGDV